MYLLEVFVGTVTPLKQWPNVSVFQKPTQSAQFRDQFPEFADVLWPPKYSEGHCNFYILTQLSKFQKTVPVLRG